MKRETEVPMRPWSPGGGGPDWRDSLKRLQKRLGPATGEPGL